MYNKEYYEKLRPEIRKNIGNALRYCRTHANKSQEDIAELVGVNKSNVSRYESGKLDIPASLLPIIADCCHFTMKDISKHLEISKMLQQTKIEDTIKEQLTDELMMLSDVDVEFMVSVDNIVKKLSDEADTKNEELANQLVAFTIEMVRRNCSNEDTVARLLRYWNSVRNHK